MTDNDNVAPEGQSQPSQPINPEQPAVPIAGGASPQEVAKAVTGVDPAAANALSQQERFDAVCASVDLEFNVLRQARDQLNLNDEALKVLHDKIKVVQLDTGLGVKFDLPEGEFGDLTYRPDADGRIGLWDAEQILAGLKRKMGDDVNLIREPEPTFVQSNPEIEVTTTEDGRYSMTSGDEGDLFQPVKQKDVVLYRSDARDTTTYKAAQAEADRRGTQLKIIEDPIHPDQQWQQGDITLPENYTMDQWREATKAQRDDPSRALWNANGQIVFPRRPKGMR